MCKLGRQRKISLFWIGIPCCTWSQVRRSGLGPPPLRSERYLTGWPDLKGRNRATVRLHDKIVYRVVELVQLCKDCRVDWVIENPESSLIWQTKPMKTVLSWSTFFSLDFCQYGERWRKRTSFATSIASLATLSRLCTSSGRYPLCSRTQKRHIQLSGIDPKTKQFRTMLACPYPKQLVRPLLRWWLGTMSVDVLHLLDRRCAHPAARAHEVLLGLGRGATAVVMSCLTHIESFL